MPDTILVLENIRKAFGEKEILRGIDLEVKKGEFVTLLGSSGCGKTTTLRIISGLETADAGRVLLEGQDVTNEEPNRRNVNTVFQNYALFPHMDVGANVGYGLKIKGFKKAEIAEKVKSALELVQLPGYESHMPNQLSGGQRQRVAIARAIVGEPKVLLLDEPLGALDLQLRRQMQLELKRLQKQLGITFIYITHDQEEALNMSDRIAVMRNGVFEQIGSPAEIYDAPRTAYVASFVGSANVLNGTAKWVNGELFLDLCGTLLPVTPLRGAPVQDQTITAAVRSEAVRFSESEGGLPAVLTEKRFAGGMLRMEFKTADDTVIVVSRHGIDSALAVGDTVRLDWERASAVLVERDPE